MSLPQLDWVVPGWRGSVLAGAMMLALWAFWGEVCMASPVADIRILIDVSGSMKRTDPDNVRRPALRLLAGLLPKGSRAGVWTFGQQVNRLVPLGTIGEPWKARALASADEIYSVDRYTDIESALRQATADWKEAGEGQRGVILLTDGVVEPSDDAVTNEASRRRILDELRPRLAQLGAHVYSIALSSEADQALLKNLAQETGGWFETTNNAADLHRIFLRIFEKAVKPDALPLSGNKFKVDGSIREVTLLLLHKPGTPPPQIQPPVGKPFDILHVPKNVRWHPDQGFDLITLEKPMVGEWRLEISEDPENRVTIVSDLKMLVTDLPSQIAEGSQIPLSVTFYDKTGQITQDAFLRMIQVGAVLQSATLEPVPQAVTVPVQEPGHSGAEFWITLDTRGGSGVMELVVAGESKTFSRERRQFIEIQPVLQAEQIPGTGHDWLLRLTATPGVTEPGSLVAEALLEPAQASPPVSLPLVVEAEGRWSATVTPPPAGGQLRIVWQAKDLQGRPLSGELTPFPLAPAPAPVLEPPVVEAPPPAADHSPTPATPPPPVETAEPINAHWWWIGINAFLLLLGGLGWWLWRRFQKDAGAMLAALKEGHPDAPENHARVDL